MHPNNKLSQNNGLSKVPALTLIFWVIKTLATTLGETDGGLALSRYSASITLALIIMA